MRISSLIRWITEYLVCLPSYNKADLFLGLSFSHNAYSVLLLQPIQFLVLEILTLGERFQRPALSEKWFHPIGVFDGRLKRQRGFLFYPKYILVLTLKAALCPPPPPHTIWTRNCTFPISYFTIGSSTSHAFLDCCSLSVDGNLIPGT